MRAVWSPVRLNDLHCVDNCCSSSASAQSKRSARECRPLVGTHPRGALPKNEMPRYPRDAATGPPLRDVGHFRTVYDRPRRG